MVLGRYDLPQQGLGIFDNFGEDMGLGQLPAGGSRSSKAAKKKDVDDDSTYTTIMLRNIPNKYTRQMLIDQLHRAGFKGDIDYMYLPTDFANRCNVGYCFVNFRTALGRQRFTGAFDGVAAQSCLPGFNSYKVCQVTRAKWQGREENVRRLRSGPELMAQLAAHPEWLPLLLDEEGNQEPFVLEEGMAATRSPAAPKRQMKKKGQGNKGVGMMSPYPAFAGAEEWALGLADAMDAGVAAPMMPSMGVGRGGGRGLGSGDGRGGRRRRGGGRGGMPGGGSYQEMAGGATYAGVPMMQVPVMTEQGLQYVPYDAYEGGYFLAYPTMGSGQQLYGMPYPPYGPGYPAGWWGGEGFDYPSGHGMWPRPKGSGRGRRNFGQAEEAVQDFPIDEGDEEDDDDLQ
mmetsp:Transcript_107729/g.197844  ORF Transcript_107729/g.197844 Transcript_107729/m.197844 type:complete len:398 (+) Transcript_107729:2-1195(+)